MEKAKLEISKTKKGDYVASLVFPNGKKQPVPNLKLKDDSLNGKEVEVEREKGQIKKIYYEGKEIYPETESKKAQATKQSKNKIIDQSPSQSTNIYSKAPYNFIPLNEKVVPAEEIPEFDRYYTENRFTGYIDIEIKALTPLYIRDALTEKEYEEKLEKEKRDETYINPDFFSPGGLPRIPGSSLRGMIRTLVEIMSFGKFTFFEKNRKYHFRSFADKSLDLREQYAKRMLGGDNNTGYFQKVNAGYLIKKGHDFYIIPAKILSNTQFFRVEEKDALTAKVINESMKILDYYTCPDKKHEKRYTKPGTCNLCKKDLIPIYKPNPNYKVGFKWVKFKFEPPKKHIHSVPLYYAKVTEIWDRNDNKAPSDAYDGALILSNWMRGPRGSEGKHLHWVIGPEDNSKELLVPREVIEDYKNDRNRDEDTDLLKYFKDNPKAKIPCFYVEKHGKVLSFGHTGLFRLAYLKSLKEFVPSDLLNPETTDIAEAIFGTVYTDEDENYKKVIASRVFFEDAYLIQGELNKEPKIPKILSNPKPTTFQHYLEQDEKNINITYDNYGNIRHIRGLKTYNDSTLLRGYKLYWHKSDENWIETNEENIKKHFTQYTKIIPVKAGAVFKGRIRFENLSKVELGALLFALGLLDGLAHKLGMGKPLGLGSVKITPKLYLSDRMKRYTDLFAEWDGLNDETNKITDFKNAFEKYVLDKLRNSGAIQENTNSLWNIERMQQLKAMLDFDNKPNDDETDYLPLDEFKERKVLPKPNEIKNK
jgi:CRISPR-associated protein (TIGR03986 family)